MDPSDPLASLGDGARVTASPSPHASEPSVTSARMESEPSSMGSRGVGPHGVPQVVPNGIFCRPWPERTLVCKGCSVKTVDFDSVVGQDNVFNCEPQPQEWGYYGPVKGFVEVQPQGAMRLA